MSTEKKVVDISKFIGNKPINVSSLVANTHKLNESLIAPAKEEVVSEVVKEHSAEAIKSIEDINRIIDYLIKNRRFRDNMMFVVGINFALRVSDLIRLRFSDLINDDLTFKVSFPVFEIKTRNTRKRKRNRYITINDAVKEAVILFLEHTPNVSLSDYMFRSESNHGINLNSPLDRSSVHRILKGIAKDLGLKNRMSSHTLRKTFCYHQMVMSHHDSRKLLLLQKMLGHSSPMQTLDYIGISNEEIEDAYLKLNLGSASYNYLSQANIYEEGAG